MSRSAVRRAAATISLALCATLLMGCAVSTLPSAATSATDSYSVDDTLGAFVGLEYDYDPVRSPDELAAQSTSIIQGTVAGVQTGRVEYVPGNDTIKGSSSIVLVVNNVRPVKGELLPGNDGNVYLELANPGQHEPSYFDEAFPQGTAVVAYLVVAGDGLPQEGVDVAIADSKAGRPEGQALFLPAGPQALAIQVDGADVVWPLIGATKPGDIAATLPGGSLIAE